MDDINEKIDKKEDEKKYRDFYLKIRDKINRWAKSGKLDQKGGKWTDRFMQYLLVLPDLVHLMLKLLIDKSTPHRFRGYILLVFTYLLSPIDVIPDFIPVAGFVDDLLVLVIVLNKIINSAEPELVAKIADYWAGDEDVFAKVKEIIEVMNELSSHIPKSIYNFMKDK